MKGAHSISTRRAYGVQRVCRVWHRARSSVYARRQATTSLAGAGRSAPPRTTSWSAILAACSRRRRFMGRVPESLGEASGRGNPHVQERVRRLMREHDLQAPHRVGHAHGPKAHDGTITTEAPDVMWGTDMTTTVTVSEGAAFRLRGRRSLHNRVHRPACGPSAGPRFEALEPIRQGVRERFGEIGDGVARGLRLRHDHGSNYLADDFSTGGRVLRHRELAEFRAGNPKATASRNASSAR